MITGSKPPSNQRTGKTRNSIQDKTLEIRNLYVSVAGKEILKGVDLKIKKGEIHALMGPNGSGKSTLAYTLMGHPNYQVKNQKSKVKINGKDILNLTPDERAKLGLFLAFQNPLTIAGVSVGNFLRTAYQSLKQQKISPHIFYKLIKQKAAILGIEENFLRRSVNDGFSGGEKKKLEMLQLLLLEPDFAVIDEVDTGLDIDSLKTVATALNKLAESKGKPGFLIITHYQRIFTYLQPDFVHIMKNGKIIASGGSELVSKIEKKGYATIGR